MRCKAQLIVSVVMSARKEFVLFQARLDDLPFSTLAKGMALVEVVLKTWEVVRERRLFGIRSRSGGAPR